MLPWPGQIADNMFGLIKTVSPGGWDGVGNISLRREFRSNCARAVGKPRVSGPRAGRLDLCDSLRFTHRDALRLRDTPFPLVSINVELTGSGDDYAEFRAYTCGGNEYVSRRNVPHSRLYAGCHVGGLQPWFAVGLVRLHRQSSDHGFTGPPKAARERGAWRGTIRAPRERLGGRRGRRKQARQA